MKFKYAILMFTGILMVSLIGACKKDKLVYDEVPEINLISIEPTTVKQFQDTLVITIEYKDGDGDLGYEHPDSLSLSVLDARLNAPDFYFVKPLAPLGSTIAIQGELRFKLRSAFILGAGNQETTSYTVKLKDRKGNWSNEVVTPKVTINK
jgi:hypothetical protein